MSLINFPILYIPDPSKGRPLFNGQIYVGQPDLDPTVVINQKQLNVIEENGTVVPVAQPFVLSAGGVPVYNGKPVRLDVDGNYSIKILSKLSAQVYYIENVFEGEPVTEALLINDLSQAYEFATKQLMKDSLIVFPVGKVLNVADILAKYVVTTGASPDVGSPDLTTGLYAKLQEEVRNPLHYDVTNDAIDTTVTLLAFRDLVLADPSKEVLFPAGTYSYSTSPNWAIPKLVVRALGTVTFRNTGTGNCLIFDNPTGTTFDVNWCWDNPIFIEGGDSTGHGLYNRSVHHSKIAANIRGCGGNVQRSEFAVVDEFRITASINQGAWYSTTAPAGISLTSNTDITKETSACIWHNSIIEGVRGVGISLDRAINNQFILGTSEGNVGANIECLQNSRNNKFDGIDLEASGSSQGFIDRGRWNRWIGVFNDANSTITSDSVGSTIRDGIHDAIINAGAYTAIENVNYGANTGEITDTGTFTTITDAYDIESASIKIPNKVQGKTKFTTALTVGAFAVTPLVPGNITKTAVILANVKIGDNIDLSSLTAVPATFTKPTAVCVIDGQIDITFSQLNGAAVSPLPSGADFTITVNGK